MKIINSFKSLTRFEIILWITSVLVITVSFFLGSEFEPLTLIASLVGVTALIFVAKGDVLGQILTVVFTIIYSVISFMFHYYGEMVTCLGMTGPIALMSIVAWIRNPYKKGENTVKVAHLSTKKIMNIILTSFAVTFLFFFILKYFNTANLVVSTISITTSFLASTFMLYRSPYYALSYAANDVVLIILWIMATIEQNSYFPMVVCFVMFLCNDLYGFYNWHKMKKLQHKK